MPLTHWLDRFLHPDVRDGSEPQRLFRGRALVLSGLGAFGTAGGILALRTANNTLTPTFLTAAVIGLGLCGLILTSLRFSVRHKETGMLALIGISALLYQ